MKLCIYEEFDPKFAMQNIKEAMFELKRMVERESLKTVLFQSVWIDKAQPDIVLWLIL